MITLAVSADDFIVEEDNVVIVSRDGWLKRQQEGRDLSTTRLREGDAVLAVLPGSTRGTMALFTNFGAAYTARIADVPASTGYGEPVQKLFKLRDGERVGWLSSGGYGHTIGKHIGLGYVRHADGVTTDYLRAGTYRIESANRQVDAELHLGPLYDPDNSRVRS